MIQVWMQDAELCTSGYSPYGFLYKRQPLTYLSRLKQLVHKIRDASSPFCWVIRLFSFSHNEVFTCLGKTFRQTRHTRDSLHESQRLIDSRKQNIDYTVVMFVCLL